MNCPICGAALPPGAGFCGACGARFTGPQGYAPYVDNGYGQPYEAGPAYPPAQPAYPPAYDQGAYGRGAPAYPPQYAQYDYPQYDYSPPPKPGHASLLDSLQGFPRFAFDALVSPAGAMKSLLERGDLFTGGIVALITLVIVFLSGIALTNGVMRLLLPGLSGAGGAAGEQLMLSANYLSGKIAPSIGGIAALTQLFSMLASSGFLMLYLCAVMRFGFSLTAFLGSIAITTVPTALAWLLAMPLSLLSVWASAAVLLFGLITSLVYLCELLEYLSGMQQGMLVHAKLACVSVPMLVSIMFDAFAGGALMRGAVNSITALMTSIGSLL